MLDTVGHRSWVFVLLFALCFSTVANADATADNVGVRGIFQGVLDSMKCRNPKPTLFFISGIGGSQMSGTNSGAGLCPEVNKTVVWFADKWVLNRNLTCWGHMMSMQYDTATKRWQNSSGTELWPDDTFSGFPDGSKQKLYYAALLKHLLAKHGYVLGKDLFIISYDWRIGIQGLEQTGGLDRIVRLVRKGVNINCGQKGIVVTHSYGANVMAHILHKPKYQSWREANIKGWVPVGGPFGGAATTAWLSVLAGDFFKLFPIFSNLFPSHVTSKWPITVVGKSIYNFAFGLPSWGFMMPREFTLGKDHVVVSTPTKNYTVADQKQLLLDMGDLPGASLLNKSWSINDHAMKLGPVPGVETFCLYSTSVPTPLTLIFNQSVPRRFVMHRPMEVVTGAGDGVVDLESLRLCKRFTSENNIIEVDGPLVDHSTILAHPLGLEGLSHILGQLGVPGKPSLFTLARKVFTSPFNVTSPIKVN